MYRERERWGYFTFPTLLPSGGDGRKSISAKFVSESPRLE